MTAPIRVALFGLGAMGRNHARLLATNPAVEFVAVADADAGALARTGLRHLPCYADHEDLLAQEKVDAVVIALPTFEHARAALTAIDRGLHVLVEKPIALTVADGEEMVRRAGVQQVVLAVGHVERFNPAVQELKRRLDAGEIGPLFQLKVRREGPFPARITDVGVTHDLATHDLDILAFILDAEPEMVFAQTARRVHPSHEDLLTATLRYPGGIVANLEINWLTPTKIRQLAVNGARGLFVVDYLTQDLTWHENGDTSEGWDALAVLRGVSEGRVVRYPVARREPLAQEQETFLNAIAGNPSGIVSGADGLRALRLAEALLTSARGSTPVWSP